MVSLAAAAQNIFTPNWKSAECGSTTPVNGWIMTDIKYSGCVDQDERYFYCDE